MNKAIARVANRKPNARPILLIGPRGNGKTALLQWLRETARAVGVDIAWLTPDEISSKEELLREVQRSETTVSRFLRRGKEVASVRIGADATAMSGEVTLGLSKRAPPPLKESLLAQCHKRPLALLLDEGHALAPDVGSHLLNTAQKVAAEVPFLLVLAGTPDLRDQLNKMDATFWSRSDPVGVGLLSNEATREAIEKPLVRAGIKLAQDVAWNALAEETSNYPYFVQLMGDALWEVGIGKRATGGAPIELDAGDVALAAEAIAMHKSFYYSERYQEIDDLGLLSAARLVADRFRATESVPVDELRRAVKSEVGEERARDALRHLRHIGFVWAPPDAKRAVCLEPGIPSLMDFVLSPTGHEMPSRPGGDRG